MEPLDNPGLDPIQSNLACLRQCFPQAFTEGKVDFEVLKQMLGGAVDESPEKYGLSWNGKRKARMEALKTGTGTLRPAPEDSVKWDSTRNILIEGDNLEVLKLLRNSYANQVKLIYIDPPYNTGKDFVYPDDYQDNLRNYKEKQGELGKEANPESSGRFHTDWLNLMYPRLQIAKDLLHPDGVLFISINKYEVANLKALLDEIMGGDNSVDVLGWIRTRTPAALSQKTKTVLEFVLCYDKTKNSTRLLGVEKPIQSANTLLNQPNSYGELVLPAGIEAGFEDGPINAGMYGSDSYDVELLEDTEVMEGFFTRPVKLKARFRWSQDYLEQQMADGVRIRIATKKLLPSYEKDSYGREAIPNLIDDKVGVGTNEHASTESEDLMGKEVFSYPKPVSLLRYLVNSCTSQEEIVLDFFAGSGTTGHAVMAQNAADGGQRRYILVQLPEVLDPAKKEQKAAAAFCAQLGKPLNIAELTKERLRRAAKKIKAEHPEYEGDLGFRVFKLDSSNLKAWDPDTQNVQQSLLDAVEHIKADRSTNDVLYELLLKLGLDLAVPMQQKTIAGKVVHAIGGGVLLVCLEGGITPAVAEPLAMGIAAWHTELKPEGREPTVIFADSAFDGDVAKSNITAILEQRGLKNVRSV